MIIQIRENVYCCECAGRIILLDIQADRYFLLPERLSPAFLRFWRGETDETRDVDDLRRLASLGLVETDNRLPDAALHHRHVLVPPDRDLTSLTPLRGRLIDAARSIVYQIRAWLDISRQPLVEVLTELRGTASELLEDSEATDRQIQRTAAGFHAASRIVKQQDQCLLRSIAFKRMCRADGIQVTLVIGVTLDPFSAHAWIQSGDRVLNDTFERVRCFTPIFSV